MSRRSRRMDRSDDTNYECFCGDGFDSREQLMSHNVSSHGMGEGDSRRAVIEKYPE